MEKTDFFGKMSEKYSGKIILGTKRSKGLIGILEVKGEE